MSRTVDAEAVHAVECVTKYEVTNLTGQTLVEGLPIDLQAGDELRLLIREQ